MTEPTETVQASPVVKVASDLTAIIELHGALLTQAVHNANDPEMPGGDAMVALADVANLEAWEYRYEAAEHFGREVSHVIDEDDSWEPPLQTLCFWSEQWRVQHDSEYGTRPTIATEASFIRWALDWAWDNELHWDDFVADIRKARARLEVVLMEGLRSEAGVPCLSCESAPILRRPVAPPREHDHCAGHDGVCFIPHEVCPHDRGGLRDVWECPGCERSYDTESYRRAVTHAHFANAAWLQIGDAEDRTGVKAGTIKAWATRGHVQRRKDVGSGRVVYSVTDILRRVGEEVA